MGISWIWSCVVLGFWYSCCGRVYYSFYLYCSKNETTEQVLSSSTSRYRVQIWHWVDLLQCWSLLAYLILIFQTKVYLSWRAILIITLAKGLSTGVLLKIHFSVGINHLWRVDPSPYSLSNHLPCFHCFQWMVLSLKLCNAQYGSKLWYAFCFYLLSWRAHKQWWKSWWWLFSVVSSWKERGVLGLGGWVWFGCCTYRQGLAPLCYLWWFFFLWNIFDQKKLWLFGQKPELPVWTEWLNIVMGYGLDLLVKPFFG